jgi:SNF2 family DNA or RNA helicase
VLSKKLLTKDQELAIDRLYDHDSTLLVASMGAGKTVVALTAINELIEAGVLGRVLVIAPLKVCKEVWAQEASKWGHLSNLSVGVCIGAASTRAKILASKPDVLVINFENLVWLFRTQKAADLFDGLIVDELSKFKSGSGTQFKAIRPHLKKWSWRVGMTGTPVAEDWLGLYGQMMIVDAGAALGTRKDVFKLEYFNQMDFQGYDWQLKPDAPARLAEAIKSSVYTVPDYQHELPPITYEVVELELPRDVREIYAQLGKSMLVEVDGAAEIIAANAAVLSGKLQQVAGGFVYDEQRDPVLLSEWRINAVVEHVTQLARLGSPVMLCYWFTADYARLVARLESLGLKWAEARTDGSVDEWNDRALDVLLVHPRSAGHGLNLAAGGADVVWYGPCWSRDLWEQTNARLWRRGQREPVVVWSFVAVGTVDELIAQRVEDKAEFSALFRAHLSG